MLYINLLYAPNGGGYQNAISFISTLVDISFDFEDVCVLAFRGSEIEAICKENNIKIKSVRNSTFNKIVFEIFSCTFLKQGDVVFSLFGPPMLFSENKTLNIGGMAISNVFYKDVDFWGYLSPVRKRLKALKDRYRIWRYKKLDYWVFETDLLKEKAVNDFGFPEGHVFVIKMAPSLLVRPENVFELEKTNIIKSRPSKYKFAFVSGAHPNKRLHLLPEIARNLKDSGFSFDFVLTASNNSYLESVMSEAKELGVYENFLNLGPVSAGEVASVIDACDYVCTFSLLESFSNNFVEAWAMKKPLIVTDADWSRSACKNSAIYLDFKSVDFVTSQIIEAIKNDVVTREIVRNGAEILKIYPTPLEKTREYIDLIYMLKDKGKIKKEQLGEIKL